MNRQTSQRRSHRAVHKTTSNAAYSFVVPPSRQAWVESQVQHAPPPRPGAIWRLKIRQLARGWQRIDLDKGKNERGPGARDPTRNGNDFVWTRIANQACEPVLLRFVGRGETSESSLTKRISTRSGKIRRMGMGPRASKGLLNNGSARWRETGSSPTRLKTMRSATHFFIPMNTRRASLSSCSPQSYSKSRWSRRSASPLLAAGSRQARAQRGEGSLLSHPLRGRTARWMGQPLFVAGAGRPGLSEF